MLPKQDFLNQISGTDTVWEKENCCHEATISYINKHGINLRVNEKKNLSVIMPVSVMLLNLKMSLKMW